MVSFGDVSFKIQVDQTRPVGFAQFLVVGSFELPAGPVNVSLSNEGVFSEDDQVVVIADAIRLVLREFQPQDPATASTYAMSTLSACAHGMV